jgi:hypothetical protein
MKSVISRCGKCTVAYEVGKPRNLFHAVTIQIRIRTASGSNFPPETDRDFLLYIQTDARG